MLYLTWSYDVYLSVHYVGTKLRITFQENKNERVGNVKSLWRKLNIMRGCVVHNVEQDDAVRR